MPSAKNTRKRRHTNQYYWNRGMKAYDKDVARTACPYKSCTRAARLWQLGWRQAHHRAFY